MITIKTPKELGLNTSTENYQVQALELIRKYHERSVSLASSRSVMYWVMDGNDISYSIRDSSISNEIFTTGAYSVGILVNKMKCVYSEMNSRGISICLRVNFNWNDFIQEFLNL